MHATYRRRQLTSAVLAVAVLVGVVVAVRATQGTSHRQATTAVPTTVAATTETTSSQDVVVSSAPWTLPSPVSRAAVFAEDGRLAVLGGLGPSNATTAAIVEVDPTTGRAQTIGHLAVPVHDAAGAALGSHLFVFGGGAQSVSAAVQMYNPDGPAGAGSERAPRIASLPSPRADVAATAADGNVVLVGGYDGRQATPDVLATTDGSTFNAIAQLPVPVRYPAIAAVGHVVFVIGGELVAGGADSNAIQAVDLQLHSATSGRPSAARPLPRGRRRPGGHGIRRGRASRRPDGRRRVTVRSDHRDAAAGRSVAHTGLGR